MKKLVLIVVGAFAIGALGAGCGKSAAVTECEKTCTESHDQAKKAAEALPDEAAKKTALKAAEEAKGACAKACEAAK